MDWNELFIRQAMLIAQKSKDPSTKVGCVIVGEGNTILSMGFNGFPRGVSETKFETRAVTSYVVESTEELIPDRWERPTKYQYVEHAERNAIYNAARNGVKLAGATAYLNWGGYPCADCARAIIQAGIVKIVGPDIPFPGVGAGQHYHLDSSKIMLREARVQVVTDLRITK